MRTIGIGARRWLKRLIRRALTRLLLLYGRRRGKRGLATIRRDAELLSLVHYMIPPGRHLRLRKQVTRLLDLQPGDGSAQRILQQAYRVNDRAVLEVVALASGAVTADALADSVQVSGLEGLTARLDSGKGAVLLGMHMGNVFALLIELARREVPVSVIAYQSRKLPDRFFETMLSGTGIQTIQARPGFAALYELNKALKRGRSAFIPIDQIDKEGGVEVPFLGKCVPMPAGAASLARKLDVPVLPVLLEAADPCWKFRIGEPIELSGPASLEHDITTLTEAVDRHIRARPELWSWHQRRWHRYPFDGKTGSP